MTVEEKEVKKDSYNLHLEMKSEARRLMAADKECSASDKTVCCANYDLQKILVTPKSDVSLMYYLSKLCVWNFTIFELGNAQGYSMLWNETIGRRGSNETSSFVFNFLKLKVQDGVKDFRFYTDNCGSQNRNKNIFSMYMKASNEFNIEIIHRYVL